MNEKQNEIRISETTYKHFDKFTHAKMKAYILHASQRYSKALK